MSRFVAYFWFSYPSVPKITYNACMWYVEYICDVLCGVNGIWSSSTRAGLSKYYYRPFKSKSLLPNLANRLRTLLLATTPYSQMAHIFLFAVVVVGGGGGFTVFLSHSGNIKSFSFSTIFTFNVKTIKIQNPCMNRMERCIEMAAYAGGIYLINFSHTWNGTKCSNTAHLQTRITFFPIQYIYSTTWWNFGTTATKMWSIVCV